MGIPRLAKSVKRSEHPVFLGCENAGRRCPQLRKQLVVDGPSLAYHIHNGLRKGSVQPLYTEIRHEVLNFLAKLERYGATIAAIYFDGFLPPAKRSERMSRLSQGLKRLCALQKANPDGVAAKGNKGIPASPFLVPATIDALISSHYKERTHVVPWEADVYCAAHVQQHGGIVLSDDSDLLVHDLGIDGTLAFFGGIRLARCKGCLGNSIKAYRSLKPRQIAREFKVPHMLRYAFEIHRDPKATVEDALRRAQQPIHTASVEKFERFRSKYSFSQNLTSLVVLNPSENLLDPRISEFILQVESGSEGPIYSYLPLLLDDPTRPSAWECSSEIRVFSYSVMLPHDGANHRQVQVLEHQRQGENIVPIEVELMDKKARDVFAGRLGNRIQTISHLHGGPLTPSCWQAFGAVQILMTYIQQQPSLPPQQILEQVLDGLDGESVRSWNGVYVHAQLQAVLYSLRQLKQILGRLQSLTAPISELADHLQSLPELAILIPAYGEVSASFNVGRIGRLGKGSVGSSAYISSTPYMAQNRSRTTEKQDIITTTRGKRRRESEGEEAGVKRVKGTRVRQRKELFHASERMRGILGEYV